MRRCTVRSLSLSPVLFFIVPVAWLAVICFGLMMCRLAARSDRLYAAALAEWIRASYFAGSGKAASENRAEQGAVDALHSRHQATG